MIIDIANESGIAIDESALVSVAQFTMRSLGLHEDCELAITAVDEKRMAELHVEWMDLEGATDVLSFPMDELTTNFPTPGIVGDVVLCPAYAQRQAKNGLNPELHLLLIHGVLHCLGFDHLELSEEKIMFDLQDSILRQWQVGSDD
jgi:probable rRNA maturation factor